MLIHSCSRGINDCALRKGSHKELIYSIRREYKEVVPSYSPPHMSMHFHTSQRIIYQGRQITFGARKNCFSLSVYFIFYFMLPRILSVIFRTFFRLNNLSCFSFYLRLGYYGIIFSFYFLRKDCIRKKVYRSKKNRERRENYGILFYYIIRHFLEF